MRNDLFTTEKKVIEQYQNMTIHADSGLHEQVMIIVNRYIPKNWSIADVGAGAGAFSKRLFDNGYNVIGMDIDREKWSPDEIPFTHLDLNCEIKWSSSLFDAACCLEVIEHVENPWKLFRDLHAFIQPGGVLILSTPNVSSFLSRLLFLLNGQLHQFSEMDLVYGHINPVSTLEITTISNSTGWKVLDIIPVGYLPIFDFSELSFKTFVFNIMRGISYLVARGQKRGWSLVYVFKKDQGE